jgi:protein-S-isoprenylcysteine O-methyltransferase Ste14
VINWRRVASRARVPLGFVFAALYFWLARPTWTSLFVGGGVAAAGLVLRALASGHVKKNTELTTTGPYAYTRNPLYLGSMIIAAGFAIAALSIWVVIAAVVLFIAIYLPVVRSEEAYLHSRFPEYEAYARRVPRFFIRPRRRTGRAVNYVSTPGPQGNFSRELYWKHREYNAVLGALLMMAALVVKLIWMSS